MLARIASWSVVVSTWIGCSGAEYKAQLAQVAAVSDVLVGTISLNQDGGTAVGIVTFRAEESCSGNALYELRFLDGPARSGTFEGPNRARAKVLFYECTSRCDLFDESWSVRLHEDAGVLMSSSISVTASPAFIGGKAVGSAGGIPLWPCPK